MVLSGGTEQSHSTNIDFLDGLLDGDVDLVDGLLERVQVADDKVDLGDVLVGEILLIGFDITGEDTTMDGGVEGLHTTTEHLRCVGNS